MRHLLLTRFAVLWPAHPPSPSWLDERYRLLERYTLPAVEAQTCKNFDWVLMADPHFPEIDRQRLERYADVSWSGDVWDSPLAYTAAVRPYLEGTDWLLTTRLDSDDAISDTFVEGLQAAFVEREMWYTYPRGYIVRRGRAYPRNFPNSPFVSYGEPARAVKTAYHVPHMQAGAAGDVVVVGDYPAWVQIDHGANVKNNVSLLQVRGKLGLEWVPVSSLTQFSCDWEGQNADS